MDALLMMSLTPESSVNCAIRLLFKAACGLLLIANSRTHTMIVDANITKKVAPITRDCAADSWDCRLDAARKALPAREQAA